MQHLPRRAYSGDLTLACSFCTNVSNTR